MTSRRFSLAVWSSRQARFVQVPGTVSESTIRNFEARGHRVQAMQVETTDPAAEKAAELAGMLRDVRLHLMDARDRAKARASIAAMARRYGISFASLEASR